MTFIKNNNAFRLMVYHINHVRLGIAFQTSVVLTTYHHFQGVSFHDTSESTPMFSLGSSLTSFEGPPFGASFSLDRS